jgi:hypothetical protein
MQGVVADHSKGHSMSEQHAGLLGFLSEANEIQQELGVSVEEAFRIQRERSDERMKEYEALKADNVIQFKPRGH